MSQLELLFGSDVAILFLLLPHTDPAYIDSGFERDLEISDELAFVVDCIQWSMLMEGWSCSVFKLLH